VFANLFLGLLLLVAALFAIRWFVAADPAVLARVLKWVAIALGAVGVGLLVVSGRLGLVVMLTAMALPLIGRWRAAQHRLRAAAGPSPGRTSRIDTGYITMTLDHDSGAMDGAVRAGPYRGRRLDDLSLEALLDLLAECRAADPPSAAVLEAYLDRQHGPDWRGHADAGTSAGAGASPGEMTRAEAYDILGLAPGAGAEEIKQAHHRLMLKNHPDRGGSTYLAAKINQAKDLLLS